MTSCFKEPSPAPLIRLHSASSSCKDTDSGPGPETQSHHTLQLLILSTQLSFQWPGSVSLLLLVRFSQAFCRFTSHLRCSGQLFAREPRWTWCSRQLVGQKCLNCSGNSLRLIVAGESWLSVKKPWCQSLIFLGETHQLLVPGNPGRFSGQQKPALTWSMSSSPVHLPLSSVRRWML